MRLRNCNCAILQSCEICIKPDQIKSKPGCSQTNIQNNLSGITSPIEKGVNHKSTGIKLPKGMIKSCKKCDKMNVNLALRRIESPRKNLMGKGTGGKCHPKGTALLCDPCDDFMSNKRPDKSNPLARAEHDDDWMWLIWRTWLEHLT